MCKHLVINWQVLWSSFAVRSPTRALLCLTQSHGRAAATTSRNKLFLRKLINDFATQGLSMHSMAYAPVASYPVVGEE